MDPLIRRHEPRGTLRTLPAYLDQWGPCVQVTASTPLQGPVAAIHDAYLLRITSELSEGITGYSTAATDDFPQDVQLMYVLYWMDVLDQLWVARLEQRVTELDRVKEGACAHFPTPDKADQVAAALQTSAAVSSSEAWQAGPSDKSVPPYGTTDRIRLRDEMCNARERLFAWMRSQKGLAPPPTTVDPWPSTLPWSPARTPRRGRRASKLRKRKRRKLGPLSTLRPRRPTRTVQKRGRGMTTTPNCSTERSIQMRRTRSHLSSGRSAPAIQMARRWPFGTSTLRRCLRGPYIILHRHPCRLVAHRMYMINRPAAHTEVALVHDDGLAWRHGRDAVLKRDLDAAVREGRHTARLGVLAVADLCVERGIPARQVAGPYERVRMQEHALEKRMCLVRHHNDAALRRLLFRDKEALGRTGYAGALANSQGM